MMNRRSFLGALGIGAAGTIVAADFDWDRLLWRPKPMVVVPGRWDRGTVRVLLNDQIRTFRNVNIGHANTLLVHTSDAPEVLRVGWVHIVPEMPKVPDFRNLSLQNTAYTMGSGHCLSLTWSDPLLARI